VDIEPIQQSFFTKLQRHEKWTSIMISLEGILTLLLLANIIYLNLYLFHSKLFTPSSGGKKIQSPIITATPPTETSPTPCAACSPITPSSPVTTPRQAPVVIQNAVKDYYISLGSGTTQSNDWVDVPGIQAVIDFGQYPHIKEIHFEVSVYVPSANEWVSVRLYNETDKHPVWNSQVTTDATTTAYLTSPAISYDTGQKFYQVQMQTQLQVPATLVQSRLHIVLR
jgi:hypothetical protein